VQRKENSITSGIEKFLNSFKTKEIKPLHLDRHTEPQLLEMGNNGKIKFEIHQYTNTAFRRFTNLFGRETRIKLQELED
jgi:helix-turn-helix protein